MTASIIWPYKHIHIHTSTHPNTIMRNDQIKASVGSLAAVCWDLLTDWSGVKLIPVALIEITLLC